MSWTDALALGLRRRLPVILQTEAAESGLACLAMVMSYHGAITDLATLRRRHLVSSTGATLDVISELAQREQLNFRAVRLEIEELAQLRTPAVLQWGLNHFVVLRKVRGERAYINDPALGKRRLPLAEVSRHFSGVALELFPAPDFKPRKDKARISIPQLIGQVTGFWRPLTQVLLLTLTLEVIALVNPLFLQWIIDQVIVTADRSLLTTLALGFLLLLVTQQGVGLLRSSILLVINTSVRIQWRANVFSHLLRLPMGWFKERHLGDVVSRTGAIDQIQGVLSGAFIEALFDGALGIITLALMFFYSAPLAWIGVAAVVIYLALRLLWYRPSYAATEEFIVRSALLSTHYLETLRGIRAIKLFGRQDERQGAWQTLLVSETNAGLTTQKLQIFYGLARSVISGTFDILLLWLGTRQVVDGTLSVGMLMAFLAYRSQFDARMTDLIGRGLDLKMLQLYAERLADVVLSEPEAENRRALAEAPLEGTPSISIENLRFRYSAQDPWVLDGVTLTIEPGESVAIVGGSGCGKTTLINLLLGSLVPNEGLIRIGAIPLNRMGNSAWRQLVGNVMQDDTLFAGSIADNISFFDAQPDPLWIERCARLAAIHEDIENMPMGYQTLVGDMGTVLSGGQRQRVLLARALYKRPSILVLDEATNQVDIRREAEVIRSIRALRISRIVVSHRPETISGVERVIELAEGRVSFEGTPDEYFARVGVTRMVGR